MTPPRHVAGGGIVLLCAADGRVLRLLRDDLGLAVRAPAGAPFADLVDGAVRDKALAFLTALQTHEVAYDWEITVPIDEVLVPLHFVGARIDEGYLIMAVRSRSDLAQFNDELTRINNDQTNALRSTAKDLALATERHGKRDAAIYGELTQLNNELANLQREMARKNAELEKLNEQKNRVLGMVAHDLRNPLGVIHGYSEFLAAEAWPVLTEVQRDFVTTIKDTSEFMLRMVSDLLDVTAIESGRLDLDRQPTDLVELIERNITLKRVLSARKVIAFAFVSPPPLPLVSLDVGKIQQVLNNLITNAVKFSHRGNPVVVRLAAADGVVTVAVRDQGQGIPAADLPKLFTPFGKSSVRSTEGEQSTGLGLAIVRRIIEGHGGRIWVESTVGEGSTFFFTLPVADLATPPA